MISTHACSAHFLARTRSNFNVVSLAPCSRFRLSSQNCSPRHHRHVHFSWRSRNCPKQHRRAPYRRSLPVALFVDLAFQSAVPGPLERVDVDSLRSLAEDQLQRVVSSQLRNLSDADVSKLAHCVNLKKLDISCSHSTCGYFMPATSRLTCLIVYTSGSAVTDLSHVRNLVQLEELKADCMCLQAIPICDQAYHLYRLLDCRQLKSLDGIQHCVNLKKLYVSGSHSIYDYFLPAARFTCLLVCISGSVVTDLSFGEKNSALEQLSISSMCFQASPSCDQAYHLYRLLDCSQLKSLEGIQHCVNLKTLDISGLRPHL